MVKALIACRSLIGGRQAERVAVSGLVDLLAMCYLFAVVITISLSRRSALLYCPPPLLARLAARPLVSSPRLMKTSFPKEKFLARLAGGTALDFIKAWSRLSVLKNFFFLLLLLLWSIKRPIEKLGMGKKVDSPTFFLFPWGKTPNELTRSFRCWNSFSISPWQCFPCLVILTSTSDRKSFLQLSDSFTSTSCWLNLHYRSPPDVQKLLNSVICDLKSTWALTSALLALSLETASRFKWEWRWGCVASFNETALHSLPCPPLEEERFSRPSPTLTKLWQNRLFSTSLKH